MRSVVKENSNTSLDGSVMIEQIFRNSSGMGDIGDYVKISKLCNIGPDQIIKYKTKEKLEEFILKSMKQNVKDSLKDLNLIEKQRNARLEQFEEEFNQRFSKDKMNGFYKWLQISTENQELEKKLRQRLVTEVLLNDKKIPMKKRRRPQSALHMSRSRFSLKEKGSNLLVSGGVLQEYLDNTFKQFVAEKERVILKEKNDGTFKTNLKYTRNGKLIDHSHKRKTHKRRRTMSSVKSDGDALYNLFKTIPKRKTGLDH